MIVLSLFDGISCGRLALARLRLPVTAYYASEIDPKAIAVAQANFPHTIQIGDVREVSFANGTLRTKTQSFNIGHVDLLLAGSPCQGLSRCNSQQLGLSDSRSILYFEFERLLHEIKPKAFLFENVRVKSDVDSFISNRLKCKPLKINSNIVCAQDRLRFYWCSHRPHKHSKSRFNYQPTAFPKTLAASATGTS